MVQQDANLIVTLVHGTWARRAAWVQPGSQFRQQLEARVPGLRRIEVFEWSGRNSDSARDDAATSLLEHAKQIRLNDAGARHYIIAHSHGGTVALMAFESEHEVDGIACLSTPFVGFRDVQWPMELEEEDETSFVGLGSYGGAAYTMFAAGQLLFWLAWTLLPIWVTLIAAVLLLLVSGHFLELVEISGYRKGGHLESQLKGLNLLIIRSPGDEASGALAAVHLLSWIAGRFHRLVLWFVLRPAVFVNGILSRIERALGGRMGLWTVAVIGIFFVLLWQIGVNYALSTLLSHLGLTPPRLLLLLKPAVLSRHEWLGVLNSAGLLVFAYLTLSGLIYCLFTVFMWLCGLPFGFWRLDPTPEYYVTVEPAPPGRWSIHVLSATQTNHDLAHSEAYSHPDSMTVLATWLTETVPGGAEPQATT